jgi:beta-1,4-mannosyltransferase
MLEPSWVAANAADFDVAHLHFGFDARTPGQLRAWVDALRAAARPLVYTVHDLRNPHHVTSEEHDRQLDVLIPAADALITLTDGAADEIEARWGRRPVVLPHPHVVDFETMRRMAARTDGRRRRETFRIGVHIKSLRASMAPAPVIAALVDTVQSVEGAVVQVDGHTDVLTEDGARYDRDLTRMLRAWDAEGRIQLRVHDYFTDTELWEYLASLDVSVLPYRFGTHSGWLEACRDLGTAVIAPSCGYYRDQGPIHEYRHDEAGFDAGSLARAVASAHAAAPPEPIDIGTRAAQREWLDHEHRRIYRAVTE